MSATTMPGASRVAAANADAWDVHGPEAAPAIILLHGTRVTRSMWRPQVAVLSRHYRIVSVDLPAHGSLAHIPFSIERARDHVRIAIGEAGGGWAIVVGQSLGGYVAMEVAAAFPELVAGLVLCNSSAEPRSVARRAPGVIGGYLVGASRERLFGRRGPVDAPIGPSETPEIQALRAIEPGEPEPPPTEGVLFRGGGRAAVTILRRRFRPLLQAYPGPTLLLNGANDPLFRRGELDFLAACTDGRLVIIDDAGHLASREQPDAFNAALLRFAGEVYAANGPD